MKLCCIALAMYLSAMVWLTAGGGDFAIADRVYAMQGDAWPLRDDSFIQTWLHKGGKYLSLGLWLLFAALTATVLRRPAWRAWRWPMIALLSSVLLSTALVALIKHSLPMFCPWDLQRYGGAHAYVGLLQPWPAGVARNACFPAAHAGTGFAWIALYFFLLRVHRAWRWYGLALGLVMGVVFATAQELRGAHFLSHDLTTLMLCGAIAFATHAFATRKAVR